MAPTTAEEASDRPSSARRRVGRRSRLRRCRRRRPIPTYASASASASSMIPRRTAPASAAAVASAAAAAALALALLSAPRLVGAFAATAPPAAAALSGTRPGAPTATSAARARAFLPPPPTGLGAATVASPDPAAGTSDSRGDVEEEEATEPRVGVLLLNLGGPETGDDVEGFLYNLFADPDIIRLPKPLAPLQSTIALFISKRRAPKSRAAYESIGGGSPILRYSNAQADLLAASLRDRHGLEVKTYVGMRYWNPFTEEALERIRDDGIDALVILPLYPQFSISTSGSSLRVLQEEFARRSDLWGEPGVVHTVVPSWYDRPGYVGAMAELINRELESFAPDEIAEGTGRGQKCARHVLFSAHGVPRSYVEAGDPYQGQIVDCVERISELLPSEDDGVKVHLSYQSRVGPIEWLRPYTDDVLPELGQNGVRNLVVVPISFVSEHIETLEEIDIEYRELAEESGITNWRRCPALNTDSAFIDDMADMVAEALSEPAQTVTEACVANNVGNVELKDMDGGTGVSVTGIGGVGAENELYEQARLREGERWNGRLAILGIAGTVLVELLGGKPLSHMLGIWG